MRRLKISTRIAVLILLMVIFIAGIVIAFWVGFGRVKDYSVDQTQTIMLNGEKEKLRVAVHSMSLSIAAAIKGVPTEEAAVSMVRSMVNDIRFEPDQSGYFFVYRGTVNVALPTKKESQGRDLGQLQDANGQYFVRELAKIAEGGGGFFQYVFPKPGKGNQPKISYVELIPGTRMFIGSGMYIDNVEEKKDEIEATISGVEKRTLMIIIFITLLLLFGLVLPLAVSIRKSIRQPLEEAVRAAKKLSEGDLMATFDTGYSDEVGILLTALQKMVEKLKEVLLFIHDTSDSVATSSRELKGASTQIAQGANQQAASAEELSASIEQMAANVNQNTENANLTRGLSEVAAANVKMGNASALESEKSMTDIAGKISIIGEIVFQTNLLALNAAVEAARAGEYGRGFSVVASEVKKLAEKSKIAADEIYNLSGSGVEVAKSTGQLLQKIVEDMTNMLNLIQEIVAANMEQNTGIVQINEAVQQLSNVTQQNAASAEEMATSAEQLAENANRLKEAVSFFRM
jgi:methyl-accepting chemotaxis protein